MIPILLASPRVEAGRLNMSQRIRTYPYVVPCRGDDQCVDAFQNGLRVDSLMLGIEIDKVLALSLAMYAGQIVADIMQPRTPGGVNGIGERPLVMSSLLFLRHHRSYPCCNEQEDEACFTLMGATKLPGWRTSLGGCADRLRRDELIVRRSWSLRFRPPDDRAGR